jgi:hypothetical protein
MELLDLLEKDNDTLLDTDAEDRRLRRHSCTCTCKRPPGSTIIVTILNR